MSMYMCMCMYMHMCMYNMCTCMAGTFSLGLEKSSAPVHHASDEAAAAAASAAVEGEEVDVAEALVADAISVCEPASWHSGFGEVGSSNSAKWGVEGGPFLIGEDAADAEASRAARVRTRPRGLPADQNRGAWRAHRPS